MDVSVTVGTARRVLVLMVVACAAGCQTYGGRARTVTLDSDPQGAVAYVIPNDKWLASGGEKMLSDPSTLEPYRVKRGTTPVPVQLHPYVYVVVMKFKDQYEFDYYKPQESGGTVTIKGPK